MPKKKPKDKEVNGRSVESALEIVLNVYPGSMAFDNGRSWTLYRPIFIEIGEGKDEDSAWLNTAASIIQENTKDGK